MYIFEEIYLLIKLIYTTKRIVSSYYLYFNMHVFRRDKLS